MAERPVGQATEIGLREPAEAGKVPERKWSRRDFLKLAAIGTAGAVLGGCAGNGEQPPGLASEGGVVEPLIAPPTSGSTPPETAATVSEVSVEPTPYAAQLGLESMRFQDIEIGGLTCSEYEVPASHLRVRFWGSSRNPNVTPAMIALALRQAGWNGSQPKTESEQMLEGNRSGDNDPQVQPCGNESVPQETDTVTFVFLLDSKPAQPWEGNVVTAPASGQKNGQGDGQDRPRITYEFVVHTASPVYADHDLGPMFGDVLGLAHFAAQWEARSAVRKLGVQRAWWETQAEREAYVYPYVAARPREENYQPEGNFTDPRLWGLIPEGTACQEIEGPGLLVRVLGNNPALSSRQVVEILQAHDSWPEDVNGDFQTVNEQPRDCRESTFEGAQITIGYVDTPLPLNRIKTSSSLGRLDIAIYTQNHDFTTRPEQLGVALDQALRDNGY